MDGYKDKPSFSREDDIYFLLVPVVEILMMVFSIIHVVLNIDRLLHVFFRLYLPKIVHPKLSDVLPSWSCERDYPFVAVQLPMLDEIECCESAIACACNLDWPKSRLLIQVLDDSTDQQTKTLINSCVQIWTDRGVQINICRRRHREGFKAGSLKNGMRFLSQAEYIAIFDVDFLPTKDYLLKTLPILISDPSVAFAQVRWTFTNSKETLLTRLQEIGLNFHHKCEQECRYRASLFFGFNGSGGTWRKSAIEQIGGWHTDTLVEDADLSFRAYLNAWRFVYMYDVKCLNELPPTLPAYISQQHRWKSGMVQVVQKLFTNFRQSRHISWGKKLYCLWFMFRCFIPFLHIFVLVVLMPLSIFVKQENIFNVISIFLSMSVNLCCVAFTPDEIHLTLLNDLFMNAMALNNAYSAISGLFHYSSSKNWIVTSKFGYKNQNICLATKLIKQKLPKLKRNMVLLDILHNKNTNHSYSNRLSLCKHFIDDCLQRLYNRMRQKFRLFRIGKGNFCMAVYLLIISYIGFQKTAYFLSIYIFSNSIMCFILALGYMGREIE